MVWIGASGGFVSRDRWDFLQKSGTVQFSMADIESLGVGEVVRRAAAIASAGCDSLYVTIDIDVEDHAFAPGTDPMSTKALPPSNSSLMDALRTVPPEPLTCGSRSTPDRREQRHALRHRAHSVFFLPALGTMTGKE
jgi:hypothetical protein